MKIHTHKFILRKKAIFYVPLVIILCLAVSSAFAEDPRQTPVVKVVQENSSSVVNISTERIVLLREYPSWGSYGSEFDLFFEQFFNNLRPTHAMKLKSVGSGVIIDKSGLVVTNAHVVNMASNIFVILDDGTSIEGEVVYEDAENDLAIVEVKSPKPLTQIKMAESGDIIIGESVVAIGNPLGLENSVTLGIVSGKNRSLHSSRGEIIFDGLIQTDAPINPGNSGGALLNLAGDLIGINLAVVQNSQSIGFAIPVEKVRKLLDSFKANQGIMIKQGKKIWPFSKFMKPKNEPQLQPPSLRRDDWNPFSEFSRMRRQMDQMMQEMFDSHDWHGGMGSFGSNLFYDNSFDTEETENAYIIRLDVADLNKNKIKIEVSGSSLTVTGERSEETEKTGPNSMFRSSSFGLFTRVLPIPSDVDTRAIDTKIEDDTLIITLPKI
jgi:S1-C subfamily serine protease/HSP20 family molecular chaperone IbpA